MERLAIFDVIIYSCIFVVLVRLICLCVHHAFSDDYLEMRWLGISLRKVSWKSIENATYLHAWKDITLKYSRAVRGVLIEKGDTYGEIIYATLKGCPDYCPKYEIRLFHKLLHPFRTVCIYLPYTEKYHYIDVFREHYPGLKIQPLED